MASRNKKDIDLIDLNRTPDRKFSNRGSSSKKLNAREKKEKK